MHNIEMYDASPEFTKCWQCAGRHLQDQTQDGLETWLRADLSPPFLEHLSFRLGNQLFFIRIEDVDERLDIPGTMGGLLSIADGCKGHACLMPMKEQLHDERWIPNCPDWGLIDARTGAPINPLNLVTEEKIEMTDWELHDFAVQMVRNQLRKEGYQLMSWQGNPKVDPSIWFVGDSKAPEWIVVRAVRDPAEDAERPANWNGIAERCATLSKIGHFACVAFMSPDDPFDPSEDSPVPLWRGHGVHVCYEGLTDG